MPVSRFCGVFKCVVVRFGVARCMVLAQKQVQLTGECECVFGCVWERERCELCPREQACSLNLLGSIPARCLNVGRVALKAGKLIFCPELFPSGFSLSVSNSLNHLSHLQLLLSVFSLYSLFFFFTIYVFLSFHLFLIRIKNTPQEATYWLSFQVILFPVFPHCSTGAQ